LCGAAGGYAACRHCNHRQHRIIKLWSKFYFGGQSGGQGLQQSRVCDGAAALTGWFPA
jgi:hypothetical protein